MIFPFMLMVQWIFSTYQSCIQLTYQTCMKNTQYDNCVYLDNKCYESNSINFGCASSLNKNLCLLQNAKCQYIQKCQSIEQSTLDRIGCEWRQLTKAACLHITQDRCTYIQEELKCQQYLKPPTIEERCETQYNTEGMFMIVSSLLCSQIQDKACIWNPSNYLCTSEIQKQVRCDDLGLSRLACIQLITVGQKCLYNKQNKNCQKDCPYICQYNFLDKCDENMNQHACLSVSGEACQFLNEKCQKINPTKCVNSKVNEKTCNIVESELCMYNLKSLSCEIPSIQFLACEAQGLNKKACMQLSDQCIFEDKCRSVDPSELFKIQCNDAVSRKTCLSIQTQLQYCQWDKLLNQCQELFITKKTQCESLISVNGNSCKAVTGESCKYSKENCINSDISDQCEAPYLNLIGCTSIVKFQTPCQWINNECKRISVSSDRSCESYTFVNPVACSLFYKMIEKKDSDFECYVNEKFTQYDYTCRYDSSTLSCRGLRKDEFSTLPCGDRNLGLNLYACSLIQTQGQVCIYRGSNCIKMDAKEQHQIQCNIIQGNPLSCSYTTYAKGPCKFNLKTCNCQNSIDPKKDKCSTIGMNSIGCGLITIEQCYYNTVNTEQFQCLPKTNDLMQNKLDCEGNSPNQRLCLAITTPGQLCKWSYIKQVCERMQIDPTQYCGYFTSVNMNVCTEIQQIEPNTNYKGYCFYDTINKSCKSWSLDRVCNLSCCSDQIGINIHVCSAMTNSDDSFCYFENQKCQKYEVKNELDFQKIYPRFNHNYTCEQFNFKLCGLINPIIDEQFYCYQSSQNDRCQTLLPNIYKQMDKSNFLNSTVRSNIWTCIQIEQNSLKVKYDPAIGKCESISGTITCEQYSVNKQACIELTKDSTCYWDEINFKCYEINPLQNQEIVCSSFSCEKLQEINNTTQCSSLSQNYAYNNYACKQINDGTSCAYDVRNNSCKIQTETISNCYLFGQNRQSCLSNTLGLCKWDDSEQNCIETIIDSLTECGVNLNKFGCLKVTSQNCQFDTQCKKLDKIFTCDELVDQTKTLLRYFNQRACVSLTNNQRCGYDIKKFQCLNQFNASNNQAIYNYTCQQFPMNVHLCLSHTKGSYCMFNKTTFQCSDYNYTSQYENCSTTNLNREVCIDSTKSCRFNLQTSICEDFYYQDQFCSELKATDGGYLFGIKACSKVSKQKTQPRFGPYHSLQCVSYQCNMEYYCTYDAVAGGCDIVNYIEAYYLESNDQQICQVKKRYLECDIKFNEFACLHLTDVPCYFDRVNFQCLSLDDTNNQIATCDSVSAAGCSLIKTRGQFCFIYTQQFSPVSCNIGLPQIQVCKYLNQLENKNVQKLSGNTTYIDPYIYTQSRYAIEYKILVNANTCGQYQDNYVIYDSDLGYCIIQYSVIGCDVQGMSYYLCNQNNNDYGCQYNSTYKYCYYNQNNSDTSKKCQDIYLSYTNIEYESTKSQQSLQCPKNAKCAYYSEAYIRNNINYTCYNCHSNATEKYNKAIQACDTSYGASYCSDYFLSQAYYCPYSCVYQSKTKKNTADPPEEVAANCTTDYATYFSFKCSCLLQSCYTLASNELSTNQQDCDNKIECQQYAFPCRQFSPIKESYLLLQTYKTMPKDLCLNSTGYYVMYDQQTLTCSQIYSSQYKCSNLNKEACIQLTNTDNLYCTWIQNQCKRIQSYEFGNLNDCTLVNLNSCTKINTNCKVVGSKCQSELAGSCNDPNKLIKNQLICSQVEENQCYMNVEQGLCKVITDRSQSFSCLTPGLNKNACLINTNQYCFFLDDKKQCLQITELGKQECLGLNVKGCTEHPNQSCYWDWDLTTCKLVSSPLASCENFLTKMPSDYQVNLQTCLNVKSACIYKNKKCITPHNEDGCGNQIYNKLGCTQNTNQFCQAIVTKNNLICVEIGDFNQICDNSFNYYACIKLIGCIWQNGMCQELSNINLLSQIYVNPYICQNLKQTGTYIYNNSNSKCEIATQKVYSCTEPYINQETCLQLTNSFCQYQIDTDVENYKDKTPRCLDFDPSQLYAQACDSSLNYKVCSNLMNSACIFIDGKCQSSKDYTCSQLSQQGVYASKQACSQTQEGFCAYDNINQRCKVIDIQTGLCDNQQPCLCNAAGVNEKLCLSIQESQNKCEFKEEQIMGTALIKKFCDYATKSNYQCSDNISMNQCVLIENCKFSNFQCSQVENSDWQACLKDYEVNGSVCAKATDVSCGYNQNLFKCIENPLEDITQIQYFNKLACIQSSLKYKLIFQNNLCQITQKALQCNEDINQFACTHIEPDSGQECIFDQKCQNMSQNECEQNKNVNNPITCQKTVDNPCKFKENSCAIATDDASECQYQGLNNLACLKPNLANCKNCAGLLLNSKCTDVQSKSLCYSLNTQCQWQVNQCISYNIQQQSCEQLQSGVNQNACFSVNMDNFIDKACVYDQYIDKCKVQEAKSCQFFNSKQTCILNTKLSCVWNQNKCVEQTPLINQDYCTTYLGSNQFCIQIERFDASCELISGECQEAQYKQQNWENYVNKKGCLQQKRKYCKWQSRCICFDGDARIQQQQELTCSQDLSFLLCLSIQTAGQFCQLQFGLCNQLILTQSFMWNQYSLINPNVCTQVDQYPVGYDQAKYSCQILKKIDQCDFPGLNFISCLSDLLDYPCKWLNNKCQRIQGLSRILQQQTGKVNAAYCYELNEPVYYDGKSCQRVNESTKCDEWGLSKLGCLSVQFEACRWMSDDEGCINDYPFNQCELNEGMVNAVYCKYVEIGQCKYDQKSKSCVSAKFDTWIYSYQDQQCVCNAQSCDLNKINEECVMPATQGLNQFACTSIQGAIFKNYECQLVNKYSNCPKLLPVNVLACKYVIDVCVYDPVDENCSSDTYNGVCEDISLSQLGCQQKNCFYYNNQCMCKQLAQVNCLTNNQSECIYNNLCYWENFQCHINKCDGLTDNCQSQENCYRIMKNGTQACAYANSCEEVQLDKNIQTSCTETIINNKPCYSSASSNSAFPCVTLQCQSFNNYVQCTSTQIGNFKISEYCIYINNSCQPIQCIDIQNEDKCNQQNGCYFVLAKNNQKVCQQFKSCEFTYSDYVYPSAEFVCNKLEFQDSNKNYIPCAWKEDRCVPNPCQYLGIDKKVCIGAHINNKYVCTLDQKSLTCTVCESYQKGCDCLNNDQYCIWNTNKSICQSIPCINILNQSECLNRQDCQFENTCIAKCSYHLNQQYCQENQCYWDSYNSECAECDIKFCDDSTCSNTKCCYLKQINNYDYTFNICYPKCEKIVSSQCNNTCNWLNDIELCVESDTYEGSNNLRN